MKKNIRTLSLFSGGGGLDIGFEKAGFNILFATDFNHECCETLKMNRGNTLQEHLQVVEADINKLNFDILPTNIDVIIGGPPCQSFSASGRRAGGAAGELDKRGVLFRSYCKVVNHVKPKVFLFENVRGILATNKGQDFQDIVNAFKEIGYHIDYRILDAEDYGVPQQRERLFIVGSRSDTTFLFPRPLFGSDSADGTPYITVKQAIADIQLTEKEKKETEFSGGKYSYLLPLIPPGSNYLFFTAKRGYPKPIFAYRSRFSDFLYKANPDAPVKTLIASPGKYTGPLHWDNRYLTVNEYKRIQGFPDEHKFYGNRTAQLRQIGNSVCPKIAYCLALAIKEQFFGVPSGLSFLQKDEKLSFDKRKGMKAQKTKALHARVMADSLHKDKKLYSFDVLEYSDHVTPTTSKVHDNLTVTVRGEDDVVLNVRSDCSYKLQSVLVLNIYDGVAKDRVIRLEVRVRGESEHGVQTMWNAVDNWVKQTSSFKSLIELYGHFTEPHPIFKVVSFEHKSDFPIFKFAQSCMNFDNCSKYFDKMNLLTMWQEKFNATTFIDLEKRLRGYRYDIRSHETNIAIPDGVYMVAYPFCLPYDKQMNFTVRG